MKKRLTAFLLTAIIAIMCITSVAATACPFCSDIVDEIGCSSPSLSNMANQVVKSCGEHDSCNMIYYYADTVCYCPTCQMTITGCTTHQCAVAHRDVGSSYNNEVTSVCKFW